MSATYLIICLIISIALVVLFCTKVKMNPAIALILGSLLLGVLTKVPLNDITAADGTVTNGLITVINNGFGNMMGSIGFPIGLGIILGQFVSDTGGATVIADKLVTLFPEKYAMYAVGFAGFILSIPVFFDVTFVILIPIGVALMKKLNKGIGYIVGAISIGAGIAHTLVPPTPNPLVAPEYFGFDLGVMIAAGLLFGIPMMIISVTIHGMLMKKGLWNAETDENGNGLNVDELELPEKLPSFGVSLLPIIIPIVLILLNTIGKHSGMAHIPGTEDDIHALWYSCGNDHCDEDNGSQESRSISCQFSAFSRYGIPDHWCRRLLLSCYYISRCK